MADLILDAPVRAPTGALFGSDAFAACLRAMEIPYLALNPGSSYRGLHDSVVNFLGNQQPQMLLCLHEESAVAIAHGYAKVTEQPMGVVLHSNVGLMHGSMAIFNAWCDRAPMLILGATGPWDAAKRRPWIDWIHTVSDQGGLVRDFTKWDNQPGSVEAGIEALLRAVQIARTPPAGPTYVNFDSTIQEAPIEALPAIPDVRRFQPPIAAPDGALVERAAQLLSEARNPVILAGRVSRRWDDWQARVRLAEKLQALVLSNQKLAAAFPTEHHLHPFPSTAGLAPAAAEALRAADVILSLDWLDLGGTLSQAFGSKVTATVIQASVDFASHRGWGGEHLALPPVDLSFGCPPDALVRPLTEAVRARPEATMPARADRPAPRTDRLTLVDVAMALDAEVGDQAVSLTKLSLGWSGALRPYRHPLDYLGADGGGGIGAGPGLAIGAALALKDSGRLPVAVVGDGDFLMAATAIWTAAHYGIPALIIVANNRSFYNDEQHQERVARSRGRPIENKWIGQRISRPDIDLASLARSQGGEGIGPVERREDLAAAIARAVAATRAGAVAVVDVRLPAD